MQDATMETVTDQAFKQSLSYLVKACYYPEQWDAEAFKHTLD